MGKKIRVTQEQLDKLKEENSVNNITVDVSDKFQDKLSEIAEKIGSTGASLSEQHNIEIKEDGSVDFSILFDYDGQLSDPESLKEQIEEQFSDIDINKTIEVDLTNSKNQINESFIKVDFTY